MSNEEYLRKAAHCREMAAAANTDDLKARWLDLAALWLGMVPGLLEPGTNLIQGHFENRQALAPGEQRKKA